LCDGLKANNTLTELDLTDNKIGGGVRLIGSVLSTNPTLKTLVLRNCGLKDENIQQLATSMMPCYLEKLDVTGNDLSDQSLSHFLKMYEQVLMFSSSLSPSQRILPRCCICCTQSVRYIFKYSISGFINRFFTGIHEA
jgi:hypothetical protein